MEYNIIAFRKITNNSSEWYYFKEKTKEKTKEKIKENTEEEANKNIEEANESGNDGELDFVYQIVMKNSKNKCFLVDEKLIAEKLKIDLIEYRNILKNCGARRYKYSKFRVNRWGQPNNFKYIKNKIKNNIETAAYHQKAQFYFKNPEDAEKAVEILEPYLIMAKLI